MSMTQRPMDVPKWKGLARKDLKIVSRWDL